MKSINNLTDRLGGLILLLPFLIWFGVEIYNITMMPEIRGDVEFLLTTEFSIPTGQVVSYVFFSTICFFLRKYKLGLLISFGYVFNWGYLHASANFVDMMGKPTPGIIVYLASGLMMAVSVVIGFFREE